MLKYPILLSTSGQVFYKQRVDCLPCKVCFGLATQYYQGNLKRTSSCLGPLHASICRHWSSWLTSTRNKICFRILDLGSHGPTQRWMKLRIATSSFLTFARTKSYCHVVSFSVRPFFVRSFSLKTWHWRRFWEWRKSPKSPHPHQTILLLSTSC